MAQAACLMHVEYHSMVRRGERKSHSGVIIKQILLPRGDMKYGETLILIPNPSWFPEHSIRGVEFMSSKSPRQLTADAELI